MVTISSATAALYTLSSGLETPTSSALTTKSKNSPIDGTFNGLELPSVIAPMYNLPNCGDGTIDARIADRVDKTLPA